MVLDRLRRNIQKAELPNLLHARTPGHPLQVLAVEEGEVANPAQPGGSAELLQRGLGEGAVVDFFQLALLLEDDLGQLEPKECRVRGNLRGRRGDLERPGEFVLGSPGVILELPHHSHPPTGQLDLAEPKGLVERIRHQAQRARKSNGDESRAPEGIESRILDALAEFRRDHLRTVQKRELADLAHGSGDSDLAQLLAFLKGEFPYRLQPLRQHNPANSTRHESPALHEAPNCVSVDEILRTSRNRLRLLHIAYLLQPIVQVHFAQLAHVCEGSVLDDTGTARERLERALFGSANYRIHFPVCAEAGHDHKDVGSVLLNIVLFPEAQVIFSFLVAVVQNTASARKVKERSVEPLVLLLVSGERDRVLLILYLQTLQLHWQKV